MSHTIIISKIEPIINLRNFYLDAMASGVVEEQLIGLSDSNRFESAHFDFNVDERLVTFELILYFFVTGSA